MTKKIEHIYEDEVEKKRCCTCKIYQPLENYNSCKGSWDKLRPKCKKCLHLVRMKNKERMTNYNKKYWQKTQESQKTRHKKWRENNVEHRKEYNKKWRMKNGEACDKREWQKRKNDPIHKEKQKRYRIERCKTDPGYKLGFDVRCRIRQALKSIGQGSEDGVGTNTSGFSALLAGSRSGVSYNFYSLGNIANFWNTGEGYSSNIAINMNLYHSTDEIKFDSHYKDYGFSVRCLKD